MKFLEDRNSHWRQSGLQRQLVTRTSLPGRFIIQEEREFLNFASNDYLGLAAEPRLRELLAQRVANTSVGATASRLVTGDTAIHRQLEEALAAFHGFEAALVFPSGFQANLGLMSSLPQAGDRIFSDEKNHASIIDGCRLSKAARSIYPHCDLEALRTQLSLPCSGEKFVVSESVFSMDGDLADVRGLRDLCDEFGAFLVMDEAHAVGVLGTGAGLCHREGIRPDVLVAGLGKAFGAAGGYVCASEPVREHLVNHARSFVFSTGISPVLCEAALLALAWIEGEEGDLRRARLWKLVGRLAGALSEKGWLPENAGRCPILPVVLGSPERAVAAQCRLAESGILCPAIRPPTVPAGQSRLRITLSACHLQEDVEGLLEAISGALRD